MPTSQQLQAFADACARAAETARGENGIGSLGEKTMHLALKFFYEPDPARHERKLQGYVTDAFTEHGAVEIQTAQIHRLTRKLEAFLPVTDVRVVCPIAVEKRIIWLEPASGAAVETNRSRVHEKPLEVAAGLCALKALLQNPALSVDIVCLTADEYRLLDGGGETRKRRATKYEVIPTALTALIPLRTPKDYAELLPEGLPAPFTSAVLAKTAHIRRRDAQQALNLLASLGAIQPDGKRGRENLYTYASETNKPDR